MNVYELVDSMSGSITKEQGQSANKEIKFRYVVGQCESFNDCVDQMQPYAPQYAMAPDGYWIRTSLAVNGIGNKYFDVSVTYKTLVPEQGQGQEPGQTSDEYYPGGVSWDTSGHTEHITQALDEQERFPVDAADFEGAINVSGDSVQGIDVPRPAMRYSETWILDIELAMSCQFIKAIYSLTGTVNLQPFRCFDPGECLFVGARGQWQDDQPYATVNFEFEARANNDEYYPWHGAGLTFQKKGWEHVWLRYQDAVDSSTLIKRPIAAYKSKVFHEKSWADLKIPTGTICGPRVGLNPQSGLAPQPGLGA